MSALQVVSPYRPFAPESVEHQALGPFDWIGALQMLRASVDRAMPGCETLAITDVDTDLPVPALYYRTTERRLMLWILEVTVRFLESPQFDRDTALVCPDLLVLQDLRPFFTGDLGVLVRTQPKHQDSGRQLLNGVQFFRHRSKSRLMLFYRRALAIGQLLPDALITWGADSIPLQQLVEPIVVGRVRRSGVSVQMFDARTMLASLSSVAIAQLEAGDDLALPTIPFLDFKYLRKRYMRAAFDATIGREAVEAVPA